MIAITGTGQTSYARLGSSATDASTPSTRELLAEAAARALANAGLAREDIDGLAVASFTLRPDRAIDLAVALGIAPSWIMDSGLGGASGTDMLQHAVAAIANGDANRILVLAGDAFTAETFTTLVREYNVSMLDDYSGLAGFGPNAMFALVTTLQMQELGLDRTDYGRLVCRQRAWAADNPNAAFREPLALDDYLAAPLIADPLSRFDCVPVVSGANAIVIEAARDATSSPQVVIRGVTARHNADLHEGTGLVTGLAQAAPVLWWQTGWRPEDITVLSVYDDYPAMVVAQLVDAGFLSRDHAPDDLARLLHERDLNSSGGQLSAGQCGAGAGLHGIVDAVTRLRAHEAGTRAIATGYGMVANRYGACAGIAALERA